MQNSVKEPDVQNIRAQGYPTVRGSFLRQASVVLISACAILTIFYLIRTLIISFSSEMDPSLASMYFMFGTKSAPVVNLVAGLLIILFLFFFTLSFLTVYGAAKEDNKEKLLKGLASMRNSLIYALVVSIIYTVISLCSVSVMYQAWQLGPNDEIAGQFITIRGYSYLELFPSTIFIGASVITAVILIMRLVISMHKAAEGTDITTDGTISSIVISSISALVFLFASFVSLGRLVMPAEMSNKIQIAYIGASASDVLINASLTTCFIAFVLIITRYTSRITVFRNMLYVRNFPYATNNYPQGPNRRPLVNPVAYRTAQPAPQPQPQQPEKSQENKPSEDNKEEK